MNNNNNMAQTGRDLLIKMYFDLGMAYKDILFVLAQQHNIVISERHLKRLLVSINLHRRRYSNLADVIQFIQNQLQGSGQLHGYRMMYAKCQQSGLRVRKEDVRLILKAMDPEGVQLRVARRLVRRAYFAKGPNYIWHVDCYDKLKPYGLCISGCIDGYSRKIIWLNVYHTNNDPKVVGGYFLEAVKECGGCPCIVRSDRGTENGHIRAFQHFFHRDDRGDRVYIEGASTANQRIECWWSFLRKECTHFWIDIFRNLLERGDFTGDFLDKNLVQFCFMSLMQGELDQTVEMWNTHTIRPSKNVRVPSGRPILMYYTPQIWGVEDKLSSVGDEEITVCDGEATFRSTIPCDPDVYELCVDIMRRDNLTEPMDVYQAIDLYLHLQREIVVVFFFNTNLAIRIEETTLCYSLNTIDLYFFTQ